MAAATTEDKTTSSPRVYIQCCDIIHY